jgi:hypothetical protein
MAESNDWMQPTIIHDRQPDLVASLDSSDVSQSHVGFVAGDQPKFADETAALLSS